MRHNLGRFFRAFSGEPNKKLCHPRRPGAPAKLQAARLQGRGGGSPFPVATLCHQPLPPRTRAVVAISSALASPATATGVTWSSQSQLLLGARNSRKCTCAVVAALASCCCATRQRCDTKYSFRSVQRWYTMRQRAPNSVLAVVWSRSVHALQTLALLFIELASSNTHSCCCACRYTV